MNKQRHSAGLIPPNTAAKPNPNLEASAHTQNRPLPKDQERLGALFTAGEYTEAVAVARAMTDKFPSDGWGWKVLGAVLKQTGRSQESLAPLQTALALMPLDAESHNNLGLAHRDLGELDEARLCLLRAQKIEPGGAYINSNLGLVHRDLGELDEAAACFRQALAIQPDFVAAYNNLGLTLWGQHQLRDAKTCFRRALTIAPDYAEAQSNLGIIHRVLGELTAAEACFRKALQIKPEFNDARDQLELTLQDKAQTWPLPHPENGSTNSASLTPIGAQGYVFNVANFDKFSSGLALIKESLADGGASLYCSDNIITWNRNYSFLRDNFYLNTVNDSGTTNVEKCIVWRTYILLHFAELASQAEGDFVELGCHTGYTANEVIKKLDLVKLEKNYFLYDLFGWNKSDEHTHLPGHDNPLMYEDVIKRFADHERVKIIKGSVPDSFALGFPDKIAFAHIDMNHPVPEAAALSVVLPKLQKGGVVILDDYGWWGYHKQKIALDPIIISNGLKVLELPTGQGLIMKP